MSTMRNLGDETSSRRKQVSSRKKWTVAERTNMIGFKMC